jgi:hypothetical protein
MLDGCHHLHLLSFHRRQWWHRFFCLGRQGRDGGMAQATSWTLQEAGRWDNGIMTAVDYGAYPIQDFVTTPAMTSVVIDRPDQPSLGAGEGSQGPAGAAIGAWSSGLKSAGTVYERDLLIQRHLSHHHVSPLVGREVLVHPRACWRGLRTLRNKRREWEEYRAQVTPFERDRYLPIL